MIPIRDLQSNKGAYKYLLDGLDNNKKKAVRSLIENIDFLDLEYINIENSLAVDDNSEVICVEYNAVTDRCEYKKAEVRNYENNKVATDNEGFELTITEAEFDDAVAFVDVSSDEPIIHEEEEVVAKENKPTSSIRGRSINWAFALQAYHYPEIIERSELSDTEKFMYRGLAAAMARKILKQKSNSHAKQYQLTKKDKRKDAAFVDSVFLSLILGFFSGVLLAVIVFAIRANI
jgi:hypothetical protein